MAAILVSTLPSFSGLSDVVTAAAAAHDADSVAAGAPFLGRTPFGVVAVSADGQATLADTMRDMVISW